MAFRSKLEVLLVLSYPKVIFLSFVRYDMWKETTYSLYPVSTRRIFEHLLCSSVVGDE
jgi:hypothetical protein